MSRLPNPEEASGQPAARRALSPNIERAASNEPPTQAKSACEALICSGSGWAGTVLLVHRPWAAGATAVVALSAGTAPREPSSRPVRLALRDRRGCANPSLQSSTSRDHNFEIIAGDNEAIATAPVRFIQQIENVGFQGSCL